jgi:predicted alpha/beta hydrolase family esterase
VLFVPGLRDHVADHWQTLLAAELPRSRTVEPLADDKLSRAARVAALDAAIAAIEGPVVLVAHSAGCLTTAHWARTSTRPIAGALLVTPPDIDFPLPEGYPTPDQLGMGGWLPVPRWRLPFPTFVAISQNDPLGRADRVSDLARDWGADIIDLGEVGHMNPAAGFGPWPEGLPLIDSLNRAVAL